MSYSSMGFVAATILVIVNYDVLFGKTDSRIIPARNAYRRFLIGILIYYSTDILWGVLYEHHLNLLTFFDTTVYFLFMALSILFWTQYVTAYLERNDFYARLLVRTGQLFLLIALILIAVNCFYPFMFWIDADGVYHAGKARYFVLLFQILLFLLTGVYSATSIRKAGARDRTRFRAIGFFAISMTVLVTAQTLYPLLPLYAAGCMIGTCLLHTFVIEDEKEEYRRELETLLQREKEHREAVQSARQLAYRDPLTGVKSKLAYVEKEAEMEQRIAGCAVGAFAVAVFDLNELKVINDTRGHEAGDQYIRDACHEICVCFQHSPVFRIGGDEFAAIMEGQDYENRQVLLAGFNRKMEENRKAGQVTVAAGMAAYDEKVDYSYQHVFGRADRLMYECKMKLKEMTPCAAPG